MRFKVIPNTSRVPSEGRNIGYLWTDNWNDWFEYKTPYVLTYFDSGGEKHEIGAIKIGEFEWAKGQRRPNLPNQFETLDGRFFSLGQDASYYSAIIELGEDVSSQLLNALQDVVVDPDLFGRALDENVMGVSLLRSVTVRSIEGQFRRILGGGAVLTDFSFRYDGPEPEDEDIDRIVLERIRLNPGHIQRRRSSSCIHLARRHRGGCRGFSIDHRRFEERLFGAAP